MHAAAHPYVPTRPRWLMVVLATAACVALAGCASSTDPSSPMGTPSWCARVRIQRVRTASGLKVRATKIRLLNARDLVGLLEKRAEAIAVQHGCVWRIVEHNGHPYIITSDLRLNRVDLTIDHGVVTAAYAG